MIDIAILRANPSTTAVLPTPASPINTGLFLVFLERVCIILAVSSSLPITGSSLPSCARSQRLMANLFKFSLF